eukprot:CAMPEP_0194234900 /NCGR_PEP_ID=MMETSP0158-20130606/2514_1 /TAXON_ID=33649 /ORGANISM="Thalassionema nitzschioides, Strain L26-B" /LENGTH=322 /DNA_ID=CAMNT_0038968211 /DNA_START=54 /DNA_END=1019 /DNA_ORIENTATION=+
MCNTIDTETRKNKQLLDNTNRESSNKSINHEDEQLISNERQERWNENWQSAKAEFSNLRHRNIQYNRFPCNPKHKGKPGQLVTRPLKDDEDISGNYELVFHYEKAMETEPQRTIEGAMAITKNEENGLLSATIFFDQNMRDPNMSASADYTFQEQTEKCESSDENENSSSQSQKLQRSFHAELVDEKLRKAMQFLDPNPLCTRISIIDERFGCPWIPTETAEDDDFDPRRIPTHFNTIEEAEDQFNKYQTGPSFVDDWVQSHLNLPSDIAKQIHEYVTWRPNPVLFLEPGDLLLWTGWPHSHEHKWSGSYLVARKKKRSTVW